MKRLALILSIIITSLSVSAQDSLNILTYEMFIRQVTENHPYSFRANLIAEIGKSGVTESRGAFDPRLFGKMDQKYFADKQYYSHIQGGLKIPTWFGITAESGYTLNDGAYLNPEQRVPDSGLWYAGIRMELGNGLIIDQRRAELAKARLYETSTELERILIQNKLHYEASIAYWKWQQAFKELSIYEKAYDNASLRLEAVKDAALFGDRPYIDTVEASMILQSRINSLLKAKTKYQNSRLKLEIYLWADGFVPLELSNAIPSVENVPFDYGALVQMDSLINNHPMLKINNLQIEQQRIDLKLKREQLKPNLTLKYNAISEPVNGDPVTAYSPENYNWGASFSYPIFTRKERGGVQLAKLKLQDQELKIKTTKAELKYNIESALNNYLLALEQLNVTQKMLENNQTMYDAERSLFGLGESSVFMINSRESAWIKARLELVELEGYYRILYHELMYQLMSVE